MDPESPGDVEVAIYGEKEGSRGAVAALKVVGLQRHHEIWHYLAPGSCF